MNRKKYLSLFAVLGLLVALPIFTAALARQGFEIRISALEDDTPQHVVISDVSSDSFRVSWITERPVIGGVKLNGSSFYEDEELSFHTIEVVALKPNTSYTFKLLSDAKEFVMDEGADYTVKTASFAAPDNNFLVYGQVFSPDGYSFQQGGVIVMTLSDGGKNSQNLSMVINETGGYQFDLGRTLTEDLNAAFNYEKKVSATFTVYISHDAPELEKTFSIDFSTNRQIPNIYLGDINIDVIPAVDGEIDN